MVLEINNYKSCCSANAKFLRANELVRYEQDVRQAVRYMWLTQTMTLRLVYVKNSWSIKISIDLIKQQTP